MEIYGTLTHWHNVNYSGKGGEIYCEFGIEWVGSLTLVNYEQFCCAIYNWDIVLFFSWPKQCTERCASVTEKWLLLRESWPMVNLTLHEKCWIIWLLYKPHFILLQELCKLPESSNSLNGVKLDIGIWLSFDCQC